MDAAAAATTATATSVEASLEPRRSRAPLGFELRSRAWGLELGPATDSMKRRESAREGPQEDPNHSFRGCLKRIKRWFKDVSSEPSMLRKMSEAKRACLQ
eukprot:2012559-Pyramimonas_sp.AAC.1